MLHSCNAIDGTAKKVYLSIDSSSRRFKTLLRDNYAVFGPMGAPGINIGETRFPVPGIRTSTPDGQADIADVIYAIHRCTHGHGDELPEGFELLADAQGPPGLT